jgi:deazaflavin-dependent oxidoreductase (nitroreductase family)
MLLTSAALAAVDLRSIANESTVELTTVGRTSGQPRTATIWFVVDGDRFYVQSGSGGKTDWYRNLTANPAVTLKVGGLALRGHARPITDAAETARVHALFESKYLRARVLGWFGGETGRGKVVEIEQLEPQHQINKAPNQYIGKSA